MSAQLPTRPQPANADLSRQTTTAAGGAWNDLLRLADAPVLAESLLERGRLLGIDHAPLRQLLQMSAELHELHQNSRKVLLAKLQTLRALLESEAATGRSNGPTKANVLLDSAIEELL